MKTLITGGHGFVGTHLRRRLPDALAPSKSEFNLIEKSAKELAEYLFYNQVECAIHLAGIVGGIGANKDNPGVFMYSNLLMGLNVLEAARMINLKQVINVGTVCSYPKHAPIPFKESDIWNGFPEETNAPYGIAKKALMLLGQTYNQQYNLNIVNLVPVNMAGEFDNFDLKSSHFVPAIIRKFEEAKKNNEDCINLWGTGSASREIMYAGDFAEAIVLAMGNHSLGSELINIGTGKEYTIAEVANKIKNIGNYPQKICWDATKPDGQPRRCLDISKADKLLGWRPKTSLDDIIGKVIADYRVRFLK